MVGGGLGWERVGLSELEEGDDEVTGLSLDHLDTCSSGCVAVAEADLVAGAGVELGSAEWAQFGQRGAGAADQAGGGGGCGDGGTEGKGATEEGDGKETQPDEDGDGGENDDTDGDAGAGGGGPVGGLI